MTDTIEQKCIAKGVKLTDQRKTIARLYLSQKTMVSQIIQMQMSFTKVSDIDSKISIATVYRTVKLFEERYFNETRF